MHNSEFFLIIVVYLGGLIVEYREGTQETAYGTGIHLLGHDPASDLWCSSWGMRGRTNCGRGCSFSFFIGYDKTIEERWGMVNRQIKTCRGKRHVAVEDMKLIPKLICNETAVGRNYNSLHDTEMLDRCVARTNEAYLRIQELQLKEEKRISLVKSLIEENKIDISKDDKTENQIRNLLLLQKAKQKSELYKMDEKEINVTRVCLICLSHLFFRRRFLTD